MQSESADGMSPEDFIKASDLLEEILDVVEVRDQFVKIELPGKNRLIPIEFIVIKSLDDFHEFKRYVSARSEELTSLSKIGGLRGDLKDFFTKDKLTLSKCVTMAYLAKEETWKSVGVWLQLAARAGLAFETAYMQVMAKTVMSEQKLKLDEIEAEKKD